MEFGLVHGGASRRPPYEKNGAWEKGAVKCPALRRGSGTGG